MKTIYIASYGKAEKKGIYIVKFNEETLELSLSEHVLTADFPAYLITKDNTLFAAYKNASSNNDGGGLGSFTIDGDKLILNNNFTSNGRSYTHICVSDDDQYAFVANYHTGSTASYALKDKRIDHKISAVRHTGLGPDLLKRQTGPHVHNVGFTPDHKYLYAVDLGADKVVMYYYGNGKLIEAEDRTLSVVAGSGPRHMIFSKDGHFAYLVNEIANSIMVFRYTEGHYNLTQVMRTVPHHFKGFSAAAAIRLTSSGKHLMVSNRGHDSIALYRVNQTNGKLSLLYMVHTGKEPRDFNIIDDKYIIVGAQNDDKLQVMTFDEANEKLLLTEQELSIPQPVCITINE